jgi:uncharacterized protein YndB with AHSA1/START domain
MVNITRLFKVSVEEVWAALTEVERMKVWYFDVPDFVLEEGKVFTFYGGEYLHHCRIVEIVPFHVFEHTWTHPEQSKGSSVLRWELEAVGPGETRLSLNHSGLESFADAGEPFAEENYAFGWEGIVGVFLRNYLYGIRKLRFDILLPATTAQLWDSLWKEYGRWCLPFGSGMHWKGEMKAGGRVHLLDGKENGYYSDVLFMTEGKHIRFSHVGEVKNAVEMPLDQESSRWTGCMESFTLSEVAEGTRLVVEVDTTPDAVEHMQRVYPLALEQLKTIHI